MIDRQTPGMSPASGASASGYSVVGRITRTRFARASTPYLYVAPFFIVFFVFFAYPVAYSFYVSLHSWSGSGPMKWVGWGNYNFVLSDNFFWMAIQTTAFI